MALVVHHRALGASPDTPGAAMPRRDPEEDTSFLTNKMQTIFPTLLTTKSILWASVISIAISMEMGEDMSGSV